MDRREFTSALAGAMMLAAGSACAQPTPAGPEAVFEALWREFDQKYALFRAKRIDWDALYRVYRPQVTSHTGPSELFDICAAMLGCLNDDHVMLMGLDRHFSAGIYDHAPARDFSLDLVRSKYLGGKSQRLTSLFEYGTLENGVGYFHFAEFRDMNSSREAVDQIIAGLRDAPAMVVDVRSNGGGDDRIGRMIANRFADRRRHYMTVRRRNGPRHDDFDAPVEWFVEPEGPTPFTRPVALLTNRHSASAAENFAMAMRVLPHATLIGDTTLGIFADYETVTLPNGWMAQIPFNEFVDANGVCWEGMGIRPDLRKVNRAERVRAGSDDVLEFAAAFLITGKPGPTRPFQLRT